MKRSISIVCAAMLCGGAIMMGCKTDNPVDPGDKYEGPDTTGRVTILTDGFEGGLASWSPEYLLVANDPTWKQMKIVTDAAHGGTHSVMGDSNATALYDTIAPTVLSGIVGVQFFIMAKSKDSINFAVQYGKDAGSSGGLEKKFGIGFDRSDSIMSMLYDPQSSTGTSDINIMHKAIEPNHWYKCVVEADFAKNTVTYYIDDKKVRTATFDLSTTFGFDRILIIRGRNGEWGENGKDGAKQYYADDILVYTR